MEELLLRQKYINFSKKYISFLNSTLYLCFSYKQQLDICFVGEIRTHHKNRQTL